MSLAKASIIKGLFWLIITVYHEAQGESAQGQKNVVKVILNRASAKGWPVEDVVKARKQFSCFNGGVKLMLDTPGEFKAVTKVAENVYAAMDEWLEGDNLKGATHYYAATGANAIPMPYWAKTMELVGTEGHHIFFKES